MMKVSVRYFKTDRGDQPVQHYLSKIAEKDAARIFVLIEELAREGVLTMPHGKKFTGYKNLYEIRYRRHRIVYCFQKGVVLLLHAFLKKSQETPAKELSLAVERQRKIKEGGF